MSPRRLILTLDIAFWILLAAAISIGQPATSQLRGSWAADKQPAHTLTPLPSTWL